MRKALLVLILGLTACNSAPEAPDRVLAKAQKVAQDSDLTRTRVEIRKLAQDFLQKTLPGWKVEGLNLMRSLGDRYFVYADASQDTKRETFILEAQVFTKDNGDMYWKISPYLRDADTPKYPTPGFLISPRPATAEGDESSDE